MKEVSFALESLNVVVGLSGAGKSSLVLGVLFPNLLAKIQNEKAHPLHCRAIEGFEHLRDWNG